MSCLFKVCLFPVVPFAYPRKFRRICVNMFSRKQALIDLAGIPKHIFIINVFMIQISGIMQVGS